MKAHRLLLVGFFLVIVPHAYAMNSADKPVEYPQTKEAHLHAVHQKLYNCVAHGSTHEIKSILSEELQRGFSHRELNVAEIIFEFLKHSPGFYEGLTAAYENQELNVNILNYWNPVMLANLSFCETDDAIYNRLIFHLLKDLLAHKENLHKQVKALKKELDAVMPNAGSDVPLRRSPSYAMFSDCP